MFPCSEVIFLKRFFFVIVCLAVLSLIPLTGFIISRSYRAPKDIDLEAGRALLQTYDDLDVEKVQQTVAQIEQQRLEKLAKENRALKTQEIINLIQAGKLTYRKALSDLYIAGDSLMAGLDVYGILNASHIFAEVSASLSHLEKNLNAIAAKNPPILLLHYGLNMIDTRDAQLNTFIRRYTSLLEQIKRLMPNTRVVVSLLFPVDRNKATGAEFGRIDDYNRALREMCQNANVEALDSASVFQGHNEFYGADGIHLSASFYRNYWLVYLIRELEIGA